MSFNNSARFPLNIAFGAIGGPGYQTSIVTVDSGREYGKGNWANSRGEWNVGMRAMPQADTDDLIAFFRVVKGRLYGFRFRDWSDYQVKAGQGVVIQNGDGSLQLAKQYTSGDLTEIRPISTPVSGTVVMVGGGTIDYVTGKITGGSLSNTWTGEFDIPARFDTDKMQLDALDKNNSDGILFQWGQIPIVEIRL
jgi:uncharacterized protein (TIGR02217 family)